MCGFGRLLQRRARGWRWRLGLWVLAGGAATIALVLFAGSLYLYIEQTASPWQAAGVTGLATTAVAGSFALAAHLLRKRRYRTAEAMRADDKVGRAADAAIEELFRSGKLRASDLIMMSLVAGIVLGASPSLRHKLAAGVRHGGRSRGPGG